MSYSEAIQFLYGLRLFGTKLGLENTLKLAALAGNPHERLRFIHVAGTNGKGSTCAMLESIYRGSGLRVGLFTSPHLVSFRERIQVNRELISEDDVVRLVEVARGFVSEFPETRQPTFFELVTVLALHYFAEQNCDLVIWETGLGGRLDATNIVLPLASVITNIQLDHEQWLGHTLSQIATEKAGIIKPRVPVVAAVEDPTAQEVLLATARRNHAPLVQIVPDDLRQPPLDTLRLPLLGYHQQVNAALACAAVRVLAQQIPVSEPVLRAGLEQVHWPGRLQCHSVAGGGMLLLDGAHNPAGAASLRAALEQYFPNQRPTLILGILRDKDWAAICAILTPMASRVLLAPVHSARTASPAELQRVCAAGQPAVHAIPCASLSEALEAAKDDPFVVITGSLHFVGQAMELLKLMRGSTEERNLNDWDAAAAGESKSSAGP